MKLSRSGLLPFALLALASCGASPEAAPTFTLHPPSTTTVVQTPQKNYADVAASLVPVPDALAQQFSSALPGSNPSFVSERALSSDEAPSPALGGWRRTWEVTLDGKPASLTLMAIVYAAPTASTIQREAILDVLGAPSTKETKTQTFKADGAFYALSVSPADSQTASVLYVVLLEGESDLASQTPVVGFISSSMASSLSPTFSPG